MCDQDQDQPYIALGFDANLHACQVCNDTGISQETAGYCTSCRMGKRIEQLDQFAEQLKGHGFTEAMRIVYRTTQRTENAIAAADKALMMAQNQADKRDAERYRYATDWGTKNFAVCQRLDDAWWPIKTNGPIDAAMPKNPASPVSKQG